MLLDVSGLSVFFKQPGGGEIGVISDLSFTIAHGESVGLVGESGCGKTVTGLSLLSLLPPEIARVTGRIGFEDTDLTSLSDRQMRDVRGRTRGYHRDDFSRADERARSGLHRGRANCGDDPDAFPSRPERGQGARDSR